MLAATIRVIQILDSFEIRVVITRFQPGMDPEQFVSQSLRVNLDDEEMSQDDLTIIRSLLSLWSEVTISD